MDFISDWLLLHLDELAGIIISLAYLYFSIRQNILLWPLGLISSAIYVFIFYKAGIYADMGLQVYYVIISVYGWYYWSRKTGHNPVKVKSVIHSRCIVYLLFIFAAVLFIILSQILIHFTDSDIPYIDAFTTALSISATWMLARKYIEHWIIWIVVDMVSTGVYYYKGLYFTIFLYFIYSIMAIMGYIAWLKDYRAEKNSLTLSE
jgi:nicotinamide mononucleotide transporter